MSLPLVIVVAVVAGLLVGSFLTVVFERVPAGGSVIAPPSRCDSCDLRLGPRDLVPVVSWMALRGRCRRCGAPIGGRVLVIELGNAALFVLFAVEFRDDLAVVVAFWVLAATLVAQTAIDLETQRLPRSITYVALLLGSVTLSIAAVAVDEPERIWMAALGAVIALAIMWLIYTLSRGGMGDGDVRLAPLLGLYLGWINPGIVAPGLFFGFVLGAVVGVTMMAGRRAGRRTALPFGPFLAAGSVLAVFLGQPFVDAVMQR